MRFSAILALLLLAAVCACNTQTANPTQFVLNGPSDLAFGCTGNLVGDPVTRAFPPASCGPLQPVIGTPDAGVGTVEPDAGAGGLPESASAVFLIPEKAPGLLHVAVYNGGSASYVDQDPFSPGINGLTVGRFPVAVGITGDGCWGVVANSGSCDLAVVDVVRASLAKPNPIAARSQVAGLPARPGDIVAEPSLPAGTFPLPTCDTPSGTVYVTYPSCHLVARVDLATFRVVDGIRFPPGGPPEIVGPDVTCPAECTDTGSSGAPEPDAGPEQAQPVTLAIQPQGTAHRISAGSVTTLNHGSATTASIPVPGGDRLYVAYVNVRDDDGTVPTSTIAGAGLTWTLAATIADASNHRRLSLFYATGSADGTPVQITHSSATADGTEWSVQEILGANLAAPLAQVASVTGTGASASIGLREFAGRGNGATAGFGVDAPLDNTGKPSAQLVDSRNGWTEIEEVVVNASTTNGQSAAGTLEAQFIANPDLTPGATWQLSAPFVAIAAEVTLRSGLYIGAGDSPRLVVADLDENGTPLTLQEVPLEGITGIRRLAASGKIPMGNGGEAGEFSFVYAIGDDQAIHVVDVTPDRTPAECDTQIDRRYLHTLTDVRRLACFRLGDPLNPPRRPEAVGPGIRLPGGVLPLDVTFTQGYGNKQSAPSPDNLRGNFAVVTALGPRSTAPRGVVYWLNVNDDDYPDFQRGQNLQDPDIAFGIPHALRDQVPLRWTPSSVCSEDNYPNNNGPARIAAGFPFSLNVDFPTNADGVAGAEFVPNLHRVRAHKVISTTTGGQRDVCATMCSLAGTCANGSECRSDNACYLPSGEADSSVLVYEMSQMGGNDVRAQVWTDASLVGVTDTLTITWEGALAPEDFRSRKTGGKLSLGGGSTMRLDAPGAGLCGLEPRPHDLMRLLGCTTSGDCAIDETCYVHPAAPVGVSGMCVPSARVIEFSGDCAPLLTTVRRYTVVEAGDDHAVLVTRPRALPETPIDGCIDAPQCQAIQEQLLSARESAAMQAHGTLARHKFTCEPDPVVGGPNQCIEACDADDACELGTTCEMAPGATTGRCVLGPIPPAKCIAPLQRYEFRAANAYTVLSSSAGYRNRGIVDPSTKLCAIDETKSPLLIARFGRNEPPCVDTSPTAIGPNPCTMVGMTEPIEPVNTTSPIEPRDTDAVRIRAPGVSLDIVDISIPLVLDGVPAGRYSPVQFGYQFQIQVAGGALPFIETAVLANLPTRVRRGLNGVPWVVDSGDSAVVGGTRGQIIQVVGSSSSTAQSPVRLF